ncbi:DoxX family protein [Terrimonas sp. NA20]|uniref:DoxX family protein n=1 Tax=Terrimonas ginsenosidimutans TaxID=2908004 RepID=A0ABS9L0I3_9BACT|nr:DoxX family protein [Terrimonas ginsenosidimutans]MCG2618115.1 DoxX family protein [Terrimonas ginsenosidimutans]
MQPKTVNILYWIFTIIFAALMIFSSYGSIIVNQDAKTLIHDQLGYPVYFIPFTGWAKLIGSIIILIPGLKTVKEWAYAGLFFDLIAVVYSSIALSGTVDPMMAFLLIWFVPGILSYYFWKKKMRLAGAI